MDLCASESKREIYSLKNKGSNINKPVIKHCDFVCLTFIHINTHILFYFLKIFIKKITLEFTGNNSIQEN